MQLGRLGVFYFVDRLNPEQIRAFVAGVERLGYGALWYPESRGYESFSVAGFMLGASSRLVVGSSIASIYARDAFTSRRGMLSLNALYGDRFVLGLGVSHVPMVEGVRGHVYGKPVPVMREYLDALHGPRGGCRAMAGGAGRTRAADAGAGRRPHPRRRAVQLHPGPHRRRPRHPGSGQMAGGGAEGLPGNRPREGPRTRAQRAVPLHDIGQLPQQLAAPGLHRGRVWPMAAATASSTRWCCGATRRPSRPGCGRISTAGANHVCIQPVHPPEDWAARDAALAALADT